MTTDTTRAATLSALAAKADAEAERYEANIAGGGGAVRRQSVRRERMTASAEPGGALRRACVAAT